MSKPAGQIIGRWAGVSVFAALVGVGVVALRHALETPQPLRSVLPGEARLYRWQRRSIFYKVLGAADAPPLVLLHTPGIGASGREMLSILAPLAQTYRVYALDLLGFGLSDRPGIAYSAALYRTLCQDFLREIVQEPATLVASGLSCNYAVAVAADVPDLCASLVLISPLALQGGSPPSALQQLLEKTSLKVVLYPLFCTRLASLLARRAQRESKAEAAQFYANTHQLGAEHAAMALLAGRLTENSEQQFASLHQPILMIWGTHALDNRRVVANLHRTAVLANPARQARRVELIQGASLAVHREQPEGVISAIRRWQEELARKPPALAGTSFFALRTAEAQTAYTSAVQAPSEPNEVSRRSIKPLDDMPTLAPPEAGEIQQTTVAAEADNSRSNEPEITAYCVKCKQKRTMLDARQIVMKNGRPAMQGVCSVCGSRLNRIGGIS